MANFRDLFGFCNKLKFAFNMLYLHPHVKILFRDVIISLKYNIYNVVSARDQQIHIFDQKI